MSARARAMFRLGSEEEIARIAVHPVLPGAEIEGLLPRQHAQRDLFAVILPWPRATRGSLPDPAESMAMLRRAETGRNQGPGKGTGSLLPISDTGPWHHDRRARLELVGPEGDPDDSFDVDGEEEYEDESE